MIPGFWGLAGAMWALFALYAQLGVSLFGGLVTVDYWDPSDPLALYAYCNFNDFGSAVLTLFNLLVVNNWQGATVLMLRIAPPLRKKCLD